MPGRKPRKSKRIGRMESGISDEWGVVRVDEDQERKKEHNEKIYLQYKETFDRNAKKWDLANPERKRKIKQSYEERNKGRRYMHPYHYERDRINAYQRERRKKLWIRESKLSAFTGDQVGESLSQPLSFMTTGASISYVPAPQDP